MNKTVSNSELDRLIPPEIKNDEFYAIIQKLAKQEDIRTVLEIGSSSGGGSTEAFVTGLRQNPNQPTLYCMEVSEPRFAELSLRYQNDDFVKCYNISSVSVEKFPDRQQVIDFYYKIQSNLKFYPAEQVLSWLDQDINYVKNSGFSGDGIAKIKQENKIDYFDLVLIDGSEFTGSAELAEVYGAKYICLDDITTYKNYDSHRQLLVDPNYTLLAENTTLRNGYSIFKKIEPDSEEFLSVQEKSERLLVKNYVKKDMVVFDVGANIGDYSLMLSRLVGDDGKVYSFEPASSTFNKLKKRLDENNCKNVSPFQYAIYSENTQIEFNEFPDDFSVWNSIGKPEMLDPCGSGEYIPIVQTEMVEAMKLDDFCQSNQVQSIDYLKIDVEGAESDVLQGAISLLRNKSIKLIQFEISQKMLEGLNRQAQSTFDLLTNNGYECHQILSDGKIGSLVSTSNSFYENYIAFPVLPVHFFTIVLNGQPFIKYHIDIFKQLPFKWHWHIVEGVADLKHDTSWSLNSGGHISDCIHDCGLSNDGTTEYLDEIAQLYPENITIYRQPEGIFWDGKREMVNAPLQNIQEECLLWQVDVDEFWTLEQISNARQMFIDHPDKTAAFYWCWYFVGENHIISTRNCYAQNPQQEWLRTWKFKPGAFWAAHEPPMLVETLANGQNHNIATINPFLHEETESNGLVFQHFAYVTPEQLKFKEQYYGYSGAVARWQKLQEQTHFPLLLSDYFPWVSDGTQVHTVDAMGIVPIAQKTNNEWQFLDPEEIKAKSINDRPTPLILVDGVFFQLYNTGIARVWKSVLEEWANTKFAKHLVLLDRNGTAPKIPGIQYCQIPTYSYNNTDADREMLQQVCNDLGADLFISTYYTTPLETPSVFMGYDMIPEVLGFNLSEPMWQEKHKAIEHASAYITISHHTGKDLVKVYPAIDPNDVTTAHCGAQSIFKPATDAEIAAFRCKYGINKPYFTIGAGGGYKNIELFLQAFAQLPTKSGFDIIVTGGHGLSEKNRQYTVGSTVHCLQLDDRELSIAYSGAIALVYPSKYEGFGLPIVEAFASACPVITCRNASIPEVAGDAVIYVSDSDVLEMAGALCEVQKPDVRKSLIEMGLERVHQFSWTNMANIMQSVLVGQTLSHLQLKQQNLIIFPDWSADEELLGEELSEIFFQLAQHPDVSQMTLILDTTGVADVETANALISAIVMNIMMSEDIDITESLTISLTGELAPIQWTELLPKLQGRIKLERENLPVIDLSHPHLIREFQLAEITDLAMV